MAYGSETVTLRASIRRRAAARGTLIVGGGLAGVFCALKLAPQPVTILTAGPFGEGGSSVWAQGGMAAAVATGDTPEKHLADTIAAGAGIVDVAMASLMTHAARARIEDLLSYGVPFDRAIDGRLLTGREAAHSERRIVHVQGDTAGKAIMAALVERVRATPSIQVIENVVAEDLILSDGRVVGVMARGQGGRAGDAVGFTARNVVLASGGSGHLYAVTTNPPESSGNGIALAARAGAVLADLEFVQFHPTALDVGRDPAPLATEALRGEGATLINSLGERFMTKIDPLGELAARDIVARAIHAERAAGRKVFLDARTAIGAAFSRKFPTVYAFCREAGIDPAVEPIPMAPAAHYHMGGVFTDAHGRTTVPGLWACGEVASTGVHGGNRLASNSLLEAVVFATQVANDIAGEMDGGAGFVETDSSVSVAARAPTAADDSLTSLIRQTMARDVGVVRDHDGLARAIATFDRLAAQRPSTQVANRLTVARMIAVAALDRTESRGGHYRSDYPEPVSLKARRSFTRLDQADAYAVAAAE
ncbi:MAG: L-aspartate oxidase [Ancalomicrobiaceae bacterium]|nr:L-aspartate oxidase [Ancalomicrobiaceae bacterium]